MIVRKIQERKATSGGKRLGHKPRSAHEDQPNWCRIPEEFQVPRLHECAACGVPSFCCAGLFAWRIYLRLLEISNLLTYLPYYLANPDKAVKREYLLLRSSTVQAGPMATILIAAPSFSNLRRRAIINFYLNKRFHN